MMKKVFFLAVVLAAASLNVVAMGGNCDWLCEAKGTAGNFAKGVENLVTDVYSWTANGWDVLDNKIEGLHNVDLNQKWTDACAYGIDSTNPVWANYVIQGGKIAGTVVAASLISGAIIWAAYKAGKISFSAMRTFWNSSKKAKLAMVVALGAAIAVAPSTAMAASSYMQ